MREVEQVRDRSARLHGYHWTFRGIGTALVLVGMVVGIGSVRSAPDEAVKKAIGRAQQYLLATASSIQNRGERALMILALNKSGLPANDPRLLKLVEELAVDVGTGDYQPRVQPGTANYESAVVLMALASADPTRFRPQIDMATRYLVDHQLEMGVWDYGGGQLTGDTSQTQYAVLAMWEASNLGYEVPQELWDKALHWHITRQDQAGGFSYHPVDPKGEARVEQGAVQHSTTVGGLASMVICRSQLSFAGPAPGQQQITQAGEFPFLFPVAPEPEPGEEPKEEYERQVTKAEVDEALELGTRWMVGNFTIDRPKGPGYYYLYGLERLAALLQRKTFGDADWYARGSDYLVAKQDADGSWGRDTYANHIETSFAILFLSRATQKTLQRIQILKLNEGTLSGGRGLPTGDEVSADMMLRQKSRFRSALKSSVDELLESMGDPDTSEIDEGLAATLETAKPEEIIQSLKDSRPGLRRMCRHPNPAVRQAGMWAVARLGDRPLASLLIEGLSDPDPTVYLAARDGLRFLSRRIESTPLPDEPPAKEVLEPVIEEWRQWWKNLKIDIDAEQEFDDGRTSVGR